MRRKQVHREVGEKGAAWFGDLRTDTCTKGEAASWFRTEEYPNGVNEHWLYHGTSLEGEAGISEGDFRLNLAGSNAGTLYGAFLSSCLSVWLVWSCLGSCVLFLFDVDSWQVMGFYLAEAWTFGKNVHADSEMWYWTIMICNDIEWYDILYIMNILYIMIIMMIALCRPLVSNIVAERGRMAEATLRGCIQEWWVHQPSRVQWFSNYSFVPLMSRAWWTTMMNGGRMETHWQRHAKETAELFTAFSVIERRFAAHTERLLCLMRIWYILDTFVATLALIECPLLFKCFSQFVKHSRGGLVCVFAAFHRMRKSDMSLFATVGRKIRKDTVCC